MLGWEQYFTKLTEFPNHANTNLGTVDLDHSTYVIVKQKKIKNFNYKNRDRSCDH